MELSVSIGWSDISCNIWYIWCIIGGRGPLRCHQKYTADCFPALRNQMRINILCESSAEFSLRIKNLTRKMSKILASAAAMIGSLCLSITYVKGQDDAKVTV